jgi:hypothetical protein
MPSLWQIPQGSDDGVCSTQSPGVTVLPSYHGRCIDGRSARYAIKLAPVPISVPVARAQADAWLHRWGLGHLAPDACLVVSELMTNAVAATARLRRLRPVHFAISASRDFDWLLIAVADASPGLPVLIEPNGNPGGRGLAIVSALSTRWGWHYVSHPGVNKCVWAEFSKDIHP